MTLRQRLWNPYVLVFISSSCTMVIELVASRFIAPRVGVSLYTWTSVIGVILAGISLGNYLGGRLADRYGSPTLLGIVFSLASLATLVPLWLGGDLHAFRLPFETPLLVWIVIYIAILFLVPSVILGCVSPIVVKLSLSDLKKAGTTVGKIYAWSTAGSIIGTFLTGFYLMSRFGTKATIVGVSVLLIALGAWFLTAVPWRKALGCALVLALLYGGSLLLLSRGGFLMAECMRETDYFCINVYEKEQDGRTVRELLLDRLVHSYTDLEDPTYLAYGYEKTYAGLIAPLAKQAEGIDAFFIGGGGYTFPRYLQTVLPESHIVVTEIDPGVTWAAHTWLGLPEDTSIISFNEDARQYLVANAEEDSYDVVFGDAFNDYSVPYHLTTLEFARLVDYVLRDDGIYMANIIDAGTEGHFMRAFVSTLQSVFANVVVIPSTSDWRTSTRTTWVIAGSQARIDLSRLPEGYLAVAQETLDGYLAEKPHVMLTDDYVPVDNLMIPVAEASFGSGALAPERWASMRGRVIGTGAGVLAVIGLGLAGWSLSRRRRDLAMAVADPADAQASEIEE
ncbi:MAG: fused MFS/spermidine synthase [Chloroflexi bacterium]|nr:fused MFS/spermidine synthase [Chloroflexota bacterium]